MKDRYSWTFHCLEFPEGYVFYRIDHGSLDVWTMNRDSGNMLYMWSCKCKTIVKALDLIRANYDVRNIFWEIVEN